MIATKEHLDQILTQIDNLAIKGEITFSDSDDIEKAVKGIIGEELNDSNINYVIKRIREINEDIESEGIKLLIKNFRRICGDLIT